MTTQLEELMPAYDFHEVHQRFIKAAPADVWHALTTLTLAQLTVTRPLVNLRHVTRRPATDQPLLTNGPMTLLDITAPHYAIGGAVARPWRYTTSRFEVASVAEFTRFDEPGWTKYLTDFSVTARPGGVLLATETRGYSTDRRARRRFALYWAMIRVGSSLIRRDILTTVARISEAETGHRAER